MIKEGKNMSLQMYSWNVNGIRAASKKGLIEFFRDTEMDILCLQETKVNEDTLPKEWKEESLDGYHCYWNFAEKKGYSGTGIITKRKPIQCLLGINKEEHDREGRVITLEFDDFFLMTVYTPNSARGLTRLDYREQWDVDFMNYCVELDAQKPLILCGDLNVAHKEIDLANPKSNYNKTAGFTQKEIDGLDALLEKGFTDSFRKVNQEGGNYSWWSYVTKARDKNIGWRLDYFLVSNKIQGKIVDASISSDIYGSDHCPVGIKIEL